MLEMAKIEYIMFFTVDSTPEDETYKEGRLMIYLTLEHLHQLQSLNKPHLNSTQHILKKRR